MHGKIRILGIAGSLRQGSYNRAALQAALSLAPQDALLEVFDISDIPPFSEDLEQRPPVKVLELKQRTRAADAILFVTPEYNYSIPGVLKNAIDWGSRPYGDNAWDGKPVGIMGASIGMLGTARAQYHLRQCCVFLNMYPLNQPEVMIATAGSKFDLEGNLTDQHSREKISQLLVALVDWTRKLGSKSE
ncbi:NAD(P)H-dependent oxidoreductase [Geomonas sp. RF6]|uniref:NADPH-dependent FMN reductase n=1 Tax=Geomonas sp. RF6 TaxID=2897342 RepID=UPI001E5FB7CE|nr:NAD(P)H-dependent oxidoreductase [Geomonas sp. RF6]UFS69323.1 NAD(P)H-dependent oxidoreductase [Geomonas sp. RF6]